ncbi:hypothetical protein ARAM_004615 [Aspergillus rambellii]|uniref:Palmitoyltransferase PFA4 n=2 Tax=Aspergillus subgen. Nidulantes TaxID=2720870 RepID=A0A0F8WDS1_9EURO|nr:hypothetical protein ARAM_004615 [Aspergillus rambellii]KKK21002.1 hypothetical protein AOCH_004811 [Aspergillus ochraceoroseus]
MLCSSFSISRLAIPAVCTLIAFLAYTSQYFFLHFAEAPLRESEVWRINLFALCIWICYYRSCTVDPGHIPKDWAPSDREQLDADQASSRQRWCRRCDAFKPPRAHHCKTCRRCIPKMDHHCPWTSNCVSHFTFPHFVRFLFYAVMGMGYLETLIVERAAIVWASRNLPSYLGPSVVQMAHLLVLLVLNSLTLFVLFILLVQTLHSLGSNTTTIESWEIERHETLLRRARHFGGYLPGPGGVRVRIQKQEFPYDIGIWSNIRDGMGGSANIIDPSLSWPPPDPDRIPVPATNQQSHNGFTAAEAAFNRRQAGDLKRRGPGDFQRRKRFHTRLDQDRRESDSSDEGSQTSNGDSDNGEEGWRNSEGERLGDFGVDEDAEFYDEEDIPLAILMQQRAWQQRK